MESDRNGKKVIANSGLSSSSRRNFLLTGTSLAALATASPGSPISGPRPDRHPTGVEFSDNSPPAPIVRF
ncbi:hypothetical protein ABIF97_000304 [Bradyrhizobium japonicum]